MELSSSVYFRDEWQQKHFSVARFLAKTMAPVGGLHRKTLLTFVIGLSAGFMCTYISVTNQVRTEIDVSTKRSLQFIPKDPHSHGETDDFVGPDNPVAWDDSDHESHKGNWNLCCILVDSQV